MVHCSVILRVVLKGKIWNFWQDNVANIFDSVKRCFWCNPLRRVFVIPSANVIYSISLLSFRMEKSSTCTACCSCLPRNPKCNLKSYRCVFTSKRGESQPNWSYFQSFSTSSLDRLQLLFGLLPQPYSRISFAFPLRTDRDDGNSLLVSREYL